MKFIANSINGSYLREILPPIGTDIDAVLAAIAYGSDEQYFLQNCIDEVRSHNSSKNSTIKKASGSGK